MKQPPPPSPSRGTLPPTSFPPSEYEKRIRAFQKVLAKNKFDGAIISRSVSRLYLTGFESTAGTLLIDVNEGAVFLTDFRYILMANQAMPFAKCVLLDSKKSTESIIATYTKKWKKIGLEFADSMLTVFNFQESLLNSPNWEGIDDILESLRAIKSPLEQTKIQEAVNANDALYASVVPQIEPGMTEWQIRNLFRSAADQFGHGESFDTIVCAGANGAECHHKPNLSVVQNKDSVLMDFGVLLDHYHSDMTRCISFGRPSALYRKIYQIVLEANQTTIEKIRPGMTGKEVDAIARDIISSYGYGKDFGHSLGHSIGMEIHESPNFSQYEKGIIKPGMIITVEPGIYLPGKLGIRIEDVVLITRTGCKVLTSSPR